MNGTYIQGYSNVHLIGNSIVFGIRRNTQVKTCDLICFIPDTDNISSNLGGNINV